MCGRVFVEYEEIIPVASDSELADEVVQASADRSEHLDAFALVPLRGDGPHLIEPVSGSPPPTRG